MHYLIHSKFERKSMHEAGPLLDMNQETENVAVDSQNTAPQLRQISASAEKMSQHRRKWKTIYEK